MNNFYIKTNQTKSHMAKIIYVTKNKSLLVVVDSRKSTIVFVLYPLNTGDNFSFKVQSGSRLCSVKVIAR